MAEAINTLAGLVQLNDANLSDIMPTELFDRSPVLARLFTKGASNGTLHKYIRQTVASSAAFRAINAGASKTYSQDELVTVTLKLIDASFHLDKGHVIGALEDVLDRETMRSLQQAFFEIEQQVFYGTGNDANGFAGLADNAAYNQVSDTQVINAGGTSANVQTSVWLLRTGDDAVATILGNDGVFDVSDAYEQAIQTEDSGGSTSGYYDAYRVSVLGWAALQIGSTYDAARICNVHPTDTASNGDRVGAITDDLIYEAMSLAPADKPYNLIAMNRVALRELRESRTATNVTGAPAPFPTEVAGVDVVVTDAINSTEAVVS